MINFNKIEWPECPYCGCVVNDWHSIPAYALISQHSGHGFKMKCPSAHGSDVKCGKYFYVFVKKEIIFETNKEN